MNCKQGDLAIIIKANNPDNLGRIVQCVQYLGIRWLRYRNGISEEPCWLLDRPYMTFDGKPSQTCSDNVLRPLRNPPGEDETLQWAGKPVPITASEQELGVM